jgi:site-specific recombinase XerC
VAGEVSAMTNLADHLDRYLAVRRSVGYRLEEHGRVLPEFVRFAQAKGETTVRTQTAIVWAGGASSDGQRGRRLSMVRGFARYLVAFDATTEVPPPGLHPSPVRSTPHIYTETEIARLMRARRSSPRYAGGPFAAQARDDRARDAALGQVALCGHVAAEGVASA